MTKHKQNKEVIYRQMMGQPLPNQVATSVKYEVRSASGGLHTVTNNARHAKALATRLAKQFQMDFDAYQVTTITEKL